MATFYKVSANSPQRDIVYKQLKRAIIDGDIKPGERLIETAFADIFQVSRTPVREAIRMLEHDGLVIYTPQKGSVAKPLPTIKEMQDLYMVRGGLQVMSAESVLENILPDEIERLEKDNQECADALDRRDDDAYFAALGDFNETLTASCRVPLLIRLLQQIDLFNPSTAFEKSEPSRLRKLSYDDSRKHVALQEHMAITEAIKHQDLEALKTAIATHSHNGKSAALKGYQELLRLIGPVEEK